MVAKKRGKNSINLRFPRLDTILMIEKILKGSRFFHTKTELWKKLPKKMMYQTFSVALRYLEDSKKIAIDGKKIEWVFDKKMNEGGMQFWKMH